MGDSKKSKVESKKVVVASSASKSRVDKPFKEKVVANGRETTGTNNVKTSSSKTTGNSTARSPKTPAKKLKKKGLPSTKPGSPSPNIDNTKEGASSKSVCPLSTGAVGKDACPKPRTQCTAVGEIP